MRFSNVLVAVSVGAVSAIRPFTSNIRRYSSRSITSRGSTLIPDDVAASIANPDTQTRNFITNIIENDLRENKNGGRIVTRFPPEPNGYLHLGHAKSICFNFGVAKHYKGVTHMRFDDTNPAKEEMEYVNSILQDVRWLVSTDEKKEPWEGPIRHASDYFQIIYDAAVYLIKQGLAYVDDLTPGKKPIGHRTFTSSYFRVLDHVDI
jgi:hypothetical protein